MMEDTPLDDMPGYRDLTDTERWVILAYRRLKEDYRMINDQAKDGMLDELGATKHGVLASTTFIGAIHRYVVQEMKEGST